MNTNTNTQLVNKAEALGYKLLMDGEGYFDVVPLDRASYTPEVYKASRRPWGVQTTSYGTAPTETIDLVIDGLKRAQEMVKLLNEAGL